MVSIIVCSVNSELFLKFEKNVSATIGTEYEILKFDNKGVNKSIFGVYNLLKTKAKGESVCCVHEDVLFHTNNWGKELIRIFQDKNIGLVGTVGASYKPKVPYEWCTDYREYQCNFIQNNKLGDQPEVYNFGFQNNASEELVTSLDGLFLALSNGCNKHILFDTNMSGFHAYDADICLAVINAGYKVVSTNSILLEHFSGGTHSKEWLINHIKCNLKWRKLLPISVEKGNYVKHSKKDVDLFCYYEFCKSLELYGFSPIQIWKYKFIFSLKPIHKELYAQFLMLFSLLKKKLKT